MPKSCQAHPGSILFSPQTPLDLKEPSSKVPIILFFWLAVLEWNSIFAENGCKSWMSILFLLYNEINNKIRFCQTIFYKI